MKKYVLAGCGFALCVLIAGLLAGAGFDGFPHYGWAKMALATGYLVVAVAGGALGCALGRWLFAGFLCAWWGDFFLIGPGNTFFLCGLVAFLSGHVCYSVACIVHGARWGAAGFLWVGLAMVGLFLYAQLWPGIPAGLGIPVALYICVITAMVSLALACLGRSGGLLLACGAVLFFLSDIGVASHAFGGDRMDPFRQLVKLYFPRQYLLAAAIPVARFMTARRATDQSH